MKNWNSQHLPELEAPLGTLAAEISGGGGESLSSNTQTHSSNEVPPLQDNHTRDVSDIITPDRPQRSAGDVYQVLDTIPTETAPLPCPPPSPFPAKEIGHSSALEEKSPSENLVASLDKAVDVCDAGQHSIPEKHILAEHLSVAQDREIQMVEEEERREGANLMSVDNESSPGTEDRSPCAHILGPGTSTGLESSPPPIPLQPLERHSRVKLRIPLDASVAPSTTTSSPSEGLCVDIAVPVLRVLIMAVGTRWDTGHRHACSPMPQDSSPSSPVHLLRLHRVWPAI